MNIVLHRAAIGTYNGGLTGKPVHINFKPTVVNQVLLFDGKFSSVVIFLILTILLKLLLVLLLICGLNFMCQIGG